MVIVNKTGHLRPDRYEHYELVMEHKDGTQYTYTGKTMDKCRQQFKNEFGKGPGFVIEIWDLKEDL